MILKGEKVILRPLLENDFEKYYKWHLDDNIRFQAVMHPYAISEKNEKGWFDSAISDLSNKRVIFSIVFSETNELIGYFQLTDISLINKSAFLGVIIGEKEYQGLGLGREIIKLGVEYGYNYLGLNKISLDVIKENQRAIKLYQNLGFVQEGEFLNHFFFNGSYYDIVRMALFHLLNK